MGPTDLAMDFESRVEEFCVPKTASLLDALRVIDRDAGGFAVIVDEQRKVHGTLTDGDIRRALLAGEQLTSPALGHGSTNFSFVGPQEGRAHVLDLMQARSIRQVPVLDDSGALLGIHFLNHLIGHIERPNMAVIMAGGKGTRLYPITKTVPKPMVRVAGRPILERLVLHLVSHGIREIALSVNYLSHVIEDHFGDGAGFGAKIQYLREDEPLGTAGSLSLLPEKPTDPVVVMNGDLVMSADVGSMIDFHGRSRSFATMGVKPYVHQVPFGCVESEGDRIASIREKPSISMMVNAGLYVLSPELIQEIPSEFLLITDVFDSAIRNGRDCRSFVIDEDWADVGQVGDLRKAQGDF